MYSLLLSIVLVASIGPMPRNAAAREPQLAVNGSTVMLTYGAGTGIYFASSTNSGRSFSAPVKVGDAEIVPLSRHRGPRIVMAGRAIVITAVMGHAAEDGPHAHGLPSDGNLIAWRSTDNGKTWSRGVVINDTPGAPTEGLHALASDGKGILFAAWLDKRGGDGTKLYGARSSDGGVTWSKNASIYRSPEGTICQCCNPSVAIDASGEILVMWRNWLAGARDMYLTRSRDGVTFTKPEKLGKGTWPLNACPMDGGGMIATHGKIVTAWRRDRDLFLASPGEKEIEIGEGTDVSIAPAPSGVLLVWTTPAGIRALLPGAKSVSAVAAKGSFPAIAALPDGRALAAWELDGAIRIEDQDHWIR